MRRREFVRLVGGAAAVWPVVAWGQQPGPARRIAILMAADESSAEYQGFYAAFHEGLQNLGWTEGRNITIDTRWGGFNAELTQRLAKELVALEPELIVSSTTPTTAALAQQTRTIPIVFSNLVDPIGSGFVASLPRPGGNLTGFVNNEPTMTGKWLELLKEIAPSTAKAAFLFNPLTAPYADYFLKPLKSIPSSSTVEPVALPVHTKAELESALADFAREPKGGLVALPDSFMVANRVDVIALAARYRFPLVAPYRFYPELGGLLSYGVDIVDNYRRSASYVDRILKGAKPGELPVQAPVKFELVINRKTAKTLGLTVPPNLLATADEVIE